ncbi:unnamed protein product, partial [Laminaria digitata]
ASAANSVTPPRPLGRGFAWSTHGAPPPPPPAPILAPSPPAVGGSVESTHIDPRLLPGNTYAAAAAGGGVGDETSAVITASREVHPTVALWNATASGVGAW